MGYRTDFKNSLIASLHDTASIFEDGDFERFIDNALRDYDRVKPQYITTELTLVAEQQYYDAPDDILNTFSNTYGNQYLLATKPWYRYFERFPKINLKNYQGTQKLWLDESPSSMMILLVGEKYEYTYIAYHKLTEEANTIEFPLLLIRAQAEAMKEASIRNMTKPVQLRNGQGGNITVNGTPAALYAQLLQDFERLANDNQIT